MIERLCGVGSKKQAELLIKFVPCVTFVNCSRLVIASSMSLLCWCSTSSRRPLSVFGNTSCSLLAASAAMSGHGVGGHASGFRWL